MFVWGNLLLRKEVRLALVVREPSAQRRKVGKLAAERSGQEKCRIRHQFVTRAQKNPAYREASETLEGESILSGYRSDQVSQREILAVYDLVRCNQMAS